MSDQVDQLEELARQYFVGELGMQPEDVPDAARNLMGAFEVLLRIDDRLKKQKLKTI